MRTEEGVNKMIDEMINRTKGKYITQGCSFNKECPRQMAMLKQALMSSVSLSGLVKEVLALRFNREIVQSTVQNNFQETLKPKSKNIGNFI